MGCSHLPTASENWCCEPTTRQKLNQAGVPETQTLLGTNDAERQKNAEALMRAAQKAGIEQSPEAHRAWARVVVETYLVERLKEAGVPREIESSQLKELYEESPLVRVRHLVLLASSPTEKELAGKKLAQVRREYESGTPFPKLVLKYSDDSASRARGGDLDFRGVHNLPSAVYEKAKKLKLNELSEPIDLGESIHLVQVTAIRPFDQAGAPYLELLRARRKDWEIKNFTAKIIADAEKGEL